MASFTDTQMPKFNPYIQQQPVEAMVSVGMQKQKAYEEGVQKIQTQIDNIAGLDVVRDVDKAYLQSKMNELGNRLRTVSAGDFSNFQLVNSVSGMTKSLIRDEGIQNAVNSTAKLRKEQTFMEEERKKGDLNPANEYVFNKQASAWMNNSDVGQGFNAKYDKYFDVDKFMTDTFAQVKPDGYTIDQIYVMGNDGKPLINKKTGQPELSTTMKRLKKEGRFPEKVKKTIDYVFSDPRVSKQLGINGSYNYRGYDSNTLIKKVDGMKQEQLNNVENNISTLNIQMSATNNKEEKAALQAQIDGLTESKDAINTTYNELREASVSNPDSVKALLYRDETKNRFTSMFSGVITEETILDNPGFKMEFEIQKERNDMAIKKEDMRYKWASLDQAKSEGLANRENAYRIATLKAKADAETAAGGGVTDGPLETDRDYNETFNKMGDNAWNNYSAAVDSLIFNTGVVSKKLLTAYKEKHKGMDDETAMRATINAEAKRRGMTPAGFRAKYTTEAKTYLSKNPTELNPTMVNTLSSVEKARKTFDLYNNARKIIDEQNPVAASLGKMKTLEIEVEEPSILPWMSSSSKVKLTPAMQYDLSLVFNDVKNLGGSEDESMASEAAKKRLLKQGITEKKIISILNSVRNTSASKGVVDEKYHSITPKGANPEDWKKAVDFMYNKSNTNFETNYKVRAEAIKEMGVLNPVVRQPLASGETKIDVNRKETLATYVGAYASTGQNESPGLVENAPAMMAILKDPKKGTVQYSASRDEVSGKITPKAMFYDVSGNNVGEVTLSEAEATRVGFNAAQGYQDMVVKETKSKMYVTNNNTTAYGDVEDPHTYVMGDVQFTKDDFTALKKIPYDLKGNIKKSKIVERGGVTREIYTNYIYVNTGKGEPILLELPKNGNTLEESINLFKNLTPDALNAILLNK